MRRILLLSLAVLSACSVSTQALREAGYRDSITTAGNYQAVYRQLSGELRRCMEQGLLTASVIVHSELFTDIKRGTITPTLHGGLGTKVLVVIDVSEIDANTTKVDISSKNAESDNPKFVRSILAGEPLCAK